MVSPCRKRVYPRLVSVNLIDKDLDDIGKTNRNKSVKKF